MNRVQSSDLCTLSHCGLPAFTSFSELLGICRIGKKYFDNILLKGYMPTIDRNITYIFLVLFMEYNCFTNLIDHQ